MKNILYTIILSFLFSFSVFADYQAGMNAAEAGDYETAYKEFRSAAEQGDAEAQDQIAYMLHGAVGVTQDYKEAVKWWTLAAEQGHALAQTNLGFMYELAQGVTRDYKEAAKWYGLAAEQGVPVAQFNLARLYNSGQAGIRDIVGSYIWFSIAAKTFGNNAYSEVAGKAEEAKKAEAAKKARDSVAKLMTPEQIAKAKVLARECIAKNYKNCDQKKEEISSSKIDKSKEQEVPEPKIDKLKEKCQNIGFKPNTDEFKNCVLELML